MAHDLTVEILKEIRDSIRTGNGELRSEIGELRAELRSESGELRAEMHKGFAELKVEVGELRTETREGFEAVRRELDQHTRAIYAAASNRDVQERFEDIERRLSKLERGSAS